jgi:phenylacetate-CoA ligase
MAAFHPEFEFMDKAELKKLQLQRLGQSVAHASRTPFYGRKFAEMGITPDSIQSLDDLRKLPLTTKSDLRAGFPYEFVSVPKEDLVRVHVSSGTTGTPTAVYHTQQDLDHWTGLVARCLAMIGMNNSDVFQNIVGYGLFTGGLGLHYGAEMLGCLVIPSGTGNTKRQISLMRQFRTTAIHVIPSYALKMLDAIRAEGLDPQKDLNLQYLVLGAEPHTDETRRRLEEAYGAKAYNSYGLSELNGPAVAFECPEKNGAHLWEDAYLLEVLDPDTLEPVEEGGQGELVLTNLARTAMPLIRYRTRDLASVLPGDCPCGRPHRRISRITGRSDDMFIIKGVNIYPMQVESVLMRQPMAGNNYQILLTKSGDADVVTIRVEAAPEVDLSNQDSCQYLEKMLVAALKSEILVTPRVILSPNGSIESGPGKAVRVVDKRGH